MPLDTGAIVGVTIQDADARDTTTSIETLIEAAEQVEAVQPDGDGIEEVVGDKGYHSNVARGSGSRGGPQLPLGARSRPTKLDEEPHRTRRGRPQSSTHSGPARSALAAAARRVLIA